MEFKIDYFEAHINGDPTLRYLLREAPMSYKLMNHQIDVRIGAFKVALSQYLDKVYPTNK